MSSPIFDSTFGTGRFRREEPMTTPFTPKEDRMTITDADLDYLRNINTSPGPNAGRSIDPTKPGPDADRASSEPRDMPSDENIEKAAQILGVDASAVRAALAQSDAGSVAWQHMFDLLKAARQMACRAVTASGGLDATPRTMLDIAALIGEAEEGLLTKPPLYTAPPRPDASAGLIEAAEIAETEEEPAAGELPPELIKAVLNGDTVTIERAIIAAVRATKESIESRIRSRAADRGVHGELIPDCPTEGVAARQGNGG